MYLLSLWLLFVLIFVNKVSLDLQICFDCQLRPWRDLLQIARENLLPILCILMLLISGGFFLFFSKLISEAKDGPFKIEELEDCGIWYGLLSWEIRGSQ